MLAGLEQPVRHGVGLHHQVVLIDHHQGERHAGKQGLKALIGAFSHGLAVAQDFVLVFQLGLVGAQFGYEILC